MKLAKLFEVFEDIEGTYAMNEDPFTCPHCGERTEQLALLVDNTPGDTCNLQWCAGCLELMLEANED